MVKITAIEDIYENWYADPDSSEFDKIQRGWRQLAATYKAKNIALTYQPSSNDVILDVGGGMGEVSEVLVDTHSFPTIALVDVSKNAVDLAAVKRQIKQSSVFDGYNIDLPDRSVDFAFSTHVLEHVPEPRRFLRELHRVAKKVFIEIPIDYSDKHINSKQLLSYGHVNVFTPSTARFYLESEGFKILKEFPSNTQRRADIVFYNTFLNGGIKPTPFKKGVFYAKHIVLACKRFVVAAMPSEYCFLLEPDDEFTVEDLVETQRSKVALSAE
jgi:ubiquinone/menaquinone biosynthesis C-methylase UbiE